MKVLRDASLGEALWAYLWHKVQFASDEDQDVGGRKKKLTETFRLDKPYKPLSSELVKKMACLTATTREIAKFSAWDLFCLSPEESGRLRIQLPAEMPVGKYKGGQIGRLQDLLPGWRLFLKQDISVAYAALKGYEALLKDLNSQRPILPPIVTGSGELPTVLDGKNRLFASFELKLCVTVLWGKYRSKFGNRAQEDERGGCCALG